MCAHSCMCIHRGLLQALLATEKVELDFRGDAIDGLSRLSAEINETVENIVARRLHTVMETLLEKVSFAASDRPGMKVAIDAAFVRGPLKTKNTGSNSVGSAPYFTLVSRVSPKLAKAGGYPNALPDAPNS